MTGPGASGASGAYGDIDLGSSGFWGDIEGATPAGGVDQVVPEGVQGYTGFADYANTTKEDYAQQLINPLVGQSPLGVLTPIVQLFEDALTTIFTWISGLVDLPGIIDTLDSVLQFFYNLLDTSGLLDFLGWLWNEFGEVVEAFLKPVIEFLAWLWEQFGDAVEAFLKPIFEFLAYLWEQLQPFIEEFIKPFLAFVGINLDTFGDVIKSSLTTFFNLLMFVAENINNSFDFLQDLLQGVFDFFQGLGLNTAGFFELVKNGFAAFANLTAGGIPLIQGIINNVAAALGQTGENLLAWARGLIPRIDLLAALQALFGQFLAIVPIANVNNTKVNLLNTGEFKYSSTVEAAAGWSWDSSRNKSGSIGGSAKVTANSSNRILYSNQNIRVASGDKLSATAYVYTTSFTAVTADPIRLLLIPFAGTTQLTSVVLAARGASNNAWGLIGNESSPYTVPSNVTSVQLALQVNANATGGTVNWDDIWLFKTGLMQQGLVAQLVGALGGFIGGLLGLPGGAPLGDDGASPAAAYDSGKTLFDTADATDTNLATTNGTLFGDPDGGETVLPDALPLSEILSTSGSGALLRRTVTTLTPVSGGQNLTPQGFFNSVSASGDVQAVNTGTTTALRATLDGWYLVEIAFALNVAAWPENAGWNFSPVLYKSNSTSTGSLAVFKVGADAIQTATRTNRYAQSSFIVYLPAQYLVAAGYDAEATTGTPRIEAASTGVDTYFSLSLLNRSYN